MMNRKEKETLKSFVKEATRVIMQDPEDFISSKKDEEGKVQKSLTDRNIKQKDYFIKTTFFCKYYFIRRRKKK